MKKLFLLILIMPAICFGQLYSKKELLNLTLTSSLCFVGGAFDGTTETLKFHYSQFEKVFPNANKQFWDPSYSWKNKWKNHDYTQGEKFYQSSRSLVFTTDAYHLMRTGRTICVMSAITFKFGQKKKWYKYAIDIGANYLSYTVGFAFAYDVVFKP